MKKTMTITAGSDPSASSRMPAVLLLLSLCLLMGCNGMMVVERGPKAGQLNWVGRSVAWTGWDRAGIADVVEVDGAHDVDDGSLHE